MNDFQINEKNIDDDSVSAMHSEKVKELADELVAGRKLSSYLF